MTENDRLTHKRMSGTASGYWTAASKTELMARLAEYEETGLAPDQVRALANRRFADQHDALAGRLRRWLAACIPVDKPTDSDCSDCDYFDRCEGASFLMVPAEAMEDLREYLGGGDDE